MSLDIRYSKQAKKFISKQDKSQKDRLENAINNLPTGDVKRLKGYTYYRLRVGDYRLIFDKQLNIIEVIKIDNRGETYKW